MSVLVTGGTGFVGSALLKSLSLSAYPNVKASVRSIPENPFSHVAYFCVPSIDGQTQWSEHLRDVEIVIHTAARVHVMGSKWESGVDQYSVVNLAGTLRLAEQAALAGVKRLIFISSVKVNGEMTVPGQPFTADDTPAPTDPYGVSKLEAEAGLDKISQSSGMEVVIIRPVLVYGPGVGANFRAMMKWLYRGIPLPLGSVNNRRSFVSIFNLVDFIFLCMVHPAAASQTFLVSDGDDVSTTQLLMRLNRLLGTRTLIFPFPEFMLNLAAHMLGKSAVVRRLFGNLQVDISKNVRLLNWVPQYSMADALKRTVDEFLRKNDQ